jgi:LysM repeat protein
MFVPATPDADGKIVHEVQAYQALFTIADAYKVPVDRLLALNGWQEDWPLQIGQKLVIDPGHVTPSPTLSNVQKLTPEADGNYYHTVHSGETLSWIADFYGVPLADLIAWNGLNGTSVIRPEQKLLLMVVPPVTPTATETPSPVPASPSPSPSIAPSATGTPLATTPQNTRGSALGLILGLTTIVMGGLLWWRFSHRS